MDYFEKELSEKLAEIYKNVTKLEEDALLQSQINLSLPEIHLVSILNKNSTGITISQLAKTLGVTKPTATVSVNNLVKKGYVKKEAGKKDGRQVQVFLTEPGEKLMILHKRCQREVIKKLGKNFSDEERKILLEAIDKLNIYFRKESVGNNNET